MSSLAFLLMLGWAFGRAGKTGYFIKEVGADKLAYMYIVGSLLAIGVSIMYSSVVDRLARHRFLIVQLAGACVLLILFRLIISFNMSWTPYAVFALADLIVMISFFMHFWTFANDIFDPREGKRLFPLVGSAGLIGTIAGGLLVKPVVSIIGTVNLMIVWAVIMGLAIPVVLWLDSTARANSLMPSTKSSDEHSEEEEGFLQRLSSIWQVPLLRNLTYLAIPMWLVINIVDYQYFLAMDEVFDDQDQLTAFLGIFSSITSSSSLILQTIWCRYRRTGASSESDVRSCRTGRSEHPTDTCKSAILELPCPVRSFRQVQRQCTLLLSRRIRLSAGIQWITRCATRAGPGVYLRYCKAHGNSAGRCGYHTAGCVQYSACRAFRPDGYTQLTLGGHYLASENQLLTGVGGEPEFPRYGFEQRCHIDLEHDE
jgi:hypothetical protein